MLESFIFIAVALIGGSFCTSRAMKQLDEIIKDSKSLVKYIDNKH
ncbi:hypothetical protein EG103P3_00003 [Enterococcus phage EG103P3]|nr:hypothetical protein EG103P3_00003 [Enterococcus phage EG103P3]